MSTITGLDKFITDPRGSALFDYADTWESLDGSRKGTDLMQGVILYSTALQDDTVQPGAMHFEDYCLLAQTMRRQHGEVYAVTVNGTPVAWRMSYLDEDVDDPHADIRDPWYVCPDTFWTGTLRSTIYDMGGRTV